LFGKHLTLGNLYPIKYGSLHVFVHDNISSQVVDKRR
jgi:hypothetical protein